MQSTRRFLACAVLGAVGLVPALLPALAHAQADAGTDDLLRRVRGAPGSRVGGATRGLRRDQPGQAAPVQPSPTPASPPTGSARRAAGASGG